MPLASLILALLQPTSTPGYPSHSPIDSATVRTENESIVITVYPRAPRTIKAIVLVSLATAADTKAAPKPIAPRSLEALTEKGKRATFAVPDRRFVVRITLDDDSALYLDDEGRRFGEGTGPYIVSPERRDLTLRKTE